jgi:hypothetical protein
VVVAGAADAVTGSLAVMVGAQADRVATAAVPVSSRAIARVIEMAILSSWLA